MRILRVADIPAARTGGMARAMLCSGDALRRAGHSVDYLFADGIGGARSSRLRRFATPLRLPSLVSELGRASAGYDVVEVHEPLAAPYCLARMMGRDLPPLVLFSHGLEARARLEMLRYRGRKRLKTAAKTRWSPLSVVWQAVYAIRHCDQIICLSREDAAFLSAAGVRAARITRVPLGVAETFLNGDPSEANVDRGWRLLFMGTWIIRKGILDLVEATTAVMRRRQDVTLTVAGCGPVEAHVRAAFPDDIRSRVAVVPHLASDEELAGVYRRHAILVLPSYMEGQPLVMLEAAATGLAIVAGDTSGMRDFIGRNEAGLLVPVGDAAQLARALERLIEDSAEVRRVVGVARERARGATWERSAAAMAAAYARAIGLRPHRHDRVNPDCQ